MAKNNDIKVREHKRQGRTVRAYKRGDDAGVKSFGVVVYDEPTRMTFKMRGTFGSLMTSAGVKTPKELIGDKSLRVPGGDWYSPITDVRISYEKREVTIEIESTTVVD